MASRRSKSKAGFSVEHHGRQIHVVKVNADSTAKWEQWILLRSDAHHDSKHCRRDIELRHLQEAVDRNAIVLDLGDCLDLMQGRGDNRSSKSSLRSGLLASNYFDRVIREAAEFYTQEYKGIKLSRQFALLGQGNHESAWLKFHETCPTDNLVRAIRTCDPNSQIGAGAYGGYVHFQFSFGGATNRSFTIRYLHGASSGGQITMGALDAKRIASWVVDANMIAIGHTHDSMVIPLPENGSEFAMASTQLRTRMSGSFVSVLTRMSSTRPKAWDGRSSAAEVRNHFVPSGCACTRYGNIRRGPGR